MVQIIRNIINWLYKPFRNIFPEDLFRYAVCGGGNMVFDWLLYFVIYNYVIGHDLVYLGSFCLTPHIASLCIVFPITLLTGFLLQKYITFRVSRLSGLRQLVRYVAIVLLNLGINYFGLKLCVDWWGWYPTPSKVVITLITVVISFFGSKYFSFKK